MSLQDKIYFEGIKESANKRSKQLEYASIGLYINNKLNSNEVGNL